jgi:PKD repeat protein
MLKTICFLGLVVILLISLPASCRGGATTALVKPTTTDQELTVVSSISGTLQLLRSGSVNWGVCTAGTRLSANDTIKTDTNSTAAVTFFDGSTVELAPLTEIKILELKKIAGSQATSVSLFQQIGQTTSQVAKFLDPACRYEVQTPAALAAVRGSIMYVAVASSGLTTVANIEGQVVVTAQGQEVAVPQGQHSEVKPGLPPGQPQPGLTAPPQTNIPANSTTASPGTTADLTTVIISIDNLKAELVSPNRVHLTWESAGGATGFLVQRALNANFAPIESAISILAGVRAYSDGTASPGATYYYRVLALYSVNGAIVAQAISNSVQVLIPELPTVTAPITTNPQSSTTSYPVTVTIGTPLTVLPGQTTEYMPRSNTRPTTSSVTTTTTQTSTTTTSTTGPTSTPTAPPSTTPANLPPVCSINATKTSGLAPLNVLFIMHASDPDGTIAYWDLDLNNDGRKESSGNGNPPSSHHYIFRDPGTYVCVLSVRDNLGATAQASIFIIVSGADTGLGCTLRANTYSGIEPLGVTFGLSTRGSVFSWRLEYGDEGYDSGEGRPPASLNHTYGYGEVYGAFAEGDILYTVTLTVWDGLGHTAQDTIVITVSSPQINNIWCSLSADNTWGMYSLDVNFSLDFGGNIVSWQLDYGDGASDGGSGNPPLSASHTYSGGEFIATLTVIDSQQQSAEDSVGITVLISTAVVRF